MEATSPPTLTRAPLPKRTPLGLMRKTWPLAVSWPSMREAVGPPARLRVTAEAVGLLEIDRGLAADVEVLPVDDGALAALVDRHGRAGAADGGLAGADLPAAGQRRGGQIGGQRGVGANGQGQHQCRCTALDLAAFAPRRSDFGRDDPGVQVFVPDQSVRAVHKVSQYAQFRPSQTRELLSLPSASFPLAEAPGLLPILVAASRLAVSPFGRVQLKPKPTPDRL